MQKLTAKEQRIFDAPNWMKRPPGMEVGKYRRLRREKNADYERRNAPKMLWVSKYFVHEKGPDNKPIMRVGGNGTFRYSDFPGLRERVAMGGNFITEVNRIIKERPRL